MTDSYSSITMTQTTELPAADNSSYEYEPRKRTTSEACIEDILSPACDAHRKPFSDDATTAIEEFSTETPDRERPRRRLSFIQSLPMAHAEPELPTSLLLDNSATLVVATDVSPVPTGLQGNGRPSLMSVKVYKDSLSTKLGIRFRNTNGRLQVSFIAPNSILGETMLRPGDSIVGIDGIHGCSTWSPSRAVSYLKDCIGYITLVARNPFGDPAISQLAVYKASPNVKLGIALSNDENDLLRINHLNEKRLLGDPESLLQVGDYVERINGVVCPKMDKSLAMAIIRECPSLVTIDVKKFPDEELSEEGDFAEDTFCLQSSFSQLPVALASATEEQHGEDTDHLVVTATEFVPDLAHTPVQDHAEPGFVSVTALKPTKDAKLGLALRNGENGDLLIARLPRGGLLADFPLTNGMRLHSINHRPCIDWEASRALKLLRETDGVIHLVAQNLKGDAGLVMASAQKSATSIGVSFRGSSGRRLKLCDIRADGLFAHSVLNVGDTVLAINRISCEQRRPKEAVDIVKQARDTVTILARSRSANVVVIAHEDK
mmetsp:Transcript_102773/g.154076  ORF Transcript_102773/g.154076 Transcript_102773/m.154076 type:complete len:547 (-) Transcript_102773:289-1929(-)